MSEGSRFNEGKLKWSLVSWKALEPMVRVLMFGARKYTKINFNALRETMKIWDVKIVTEKEKLEQRDYVEHVMKNNSSKINQKQGKQLVSINKNIDKTMKNVLKYMIKSGQNLEVQISTIKLNEETIILGKDMESQQMKWMVSKKKVVQSVEELHLPCTQTIVIPLKSLEVSFVVNATTDLDSLMMISVLSLEFLNISVNIESYIISKGNNNWKKGLKYTEIVESLQRHLNSFIEGADKDEESGIDHIGHILCNAMFLSYMYLFRKDMDDRYIDKNIKKE